MCCRDNKQCQGTGVEGTNTQPFLLFIQIKQVASDIVGIFYHYALHRFRAPVAKTGGFQGDLYAQFRRQIVHLVSPVFPLVAVERMLLIRFTSAKRQMEGSESRSGAPSHIFEVCDNLSLVVGSECACRCG